MAHDYAHVHEMTANGGEEHQKRLMLSLGLTATVFLAEVVNALFSQHAHRDSLAARTRFDVADEAVDRLGGVVMEEQAGLGVESRDGLHFVVGETEIKDV